MKDLDLKRTTELLTRIIEYELAGVVRFTHYALMVKGPYRLPLVAFLKAQANESLLHAQQCGEILVGNGGHPTMKIAKIDESNQHSVADVVAESLAHEERAVVLYRELLEVVKDHSVYLEEFARGMISAEEMGAMELRKMVRDYA
jgi:bacterioferritin